MSMTTDTPRDNLTLSEADLAACRPIVGAGGHVLRALCPFHGSDRQRSLRVQVHSGRFVCFACGAWGYMETARVQWREEQQRQAAFGRSPARRQRLPSRRQPPPSASEASSGVRRTQAVVVGLIAHLTGLTLQDDIATTARRRQQLGRDILASFPRHEGGIQDRQTPYFAGQTPTHPPSVQLAGSAPGP